MKTNNKREKTIMATRQTRPFFERTLSGPKVREALEALGGDFSDFEKAYNATRRSAGPRTLTDEQTEAVRHFASNGRDIQGLATTLGIQVPAARNLVARAIETGVL